MTKVKVRTSFFCQQCGAESAKWIGNCPSCGEWNTYVEEVLRKGEDDIKAAWKTDLLTAPQAIPIPDISLEGKLRLPTQDKEFNRVLGGGIVPGSLTLIVGDPGIGKSTLLLQIALAMPELKTLYVSGEESERQIRLRADRLNLSNPSTIILTETTTRNVFAQIKKVQPELVIIDSIQTLHTDVIDSTPGSISQIRECAGELQRYAKESNVPVMLIGHINKEGNVAGPKILEHIVDTVLQFEGDTHYSYRIVRTLKNRFGPTSELGIYEMLSTGLREISNPSEILISQTGEMLPGVAIGCTIEGLRPVLIEVQALVSAAVYGTAQRSSTGFELRRLGMLLAVLEKRGGFKFGSQDVFLNIAGGIRVDDPAIDLAVMASLLSSYEDVPIPSGVCFTGETGLSGEIRAVNRIEQRIAEADKLGFDKIFISKYNLTKDRSNLDLSRFNIEVVGVGKIEEIYQLLF